MAIERTWYCDQPDCERHVRAATPRPHGLIFVTDHPGPTLHFCGWDCVMKYAAAKPEEEVIPWGPQP